MVLLQAQGLWQRGHSVSVITLSSKKTDFYVLPDQIARVALDLVGESRTTLQAIRNNLRRLKALRQAIVSIRPDVVISHIDQMNVLTLLALMGTGYPVVAIEHNDPTTHLRSRVWHKLRRLTYPRTARVVSVSHGVDRYFSWLPESKRTVIHNPVNPAAGNHQPATTLPTDLAPNQNLITAMGRLTYQKGFDLLLQAFEKIADAHPHWQLMILGEGELRKDLERQRDELGLTKRVHFPGLVVNPFPVLQSSSLFVMASRYEGFPCALLEAMACGLPVVYTNCPSGPSEIIREGIDGLLVPNGDVAALSAAMDRLMSDVAERQCLGSRGPEVLERFGSDKVIAQWEALFARIVKREIGTAARPRDPRPGRADGLGQ